MDGGKSDMEQRFNHLEQRIDRSSEVTGKKFDMMATSVNKLADSVESWLSVILELTKA